MAGVGESILRWQKCITTKALRAGQCINLHIEDISSI